MSDRKNLGDLSMQELYRMEVETQAAVLTEGLMALERGIDPSSGLRGLMRAAHSLKGAARMVGREIAVRVSHAMEDRFVEVQSNKRQVSRALIDHLLRAVDFLSSQAAVPDEKVAAWEQARGGVLNDLLKTLVSPADDSSGKAIDQALVVSPVSEPEVNLAASPHKIAEIGSGIPAAGRAESLPDPADRYLRITAERLDHLMALSGEILIASRWLDSFAANLQRLKRLQQQVTQTVEATHEQLRISAGEDAAGHLNGVRQQINVCAQGVADRIADFELFDRRFAGLSRRLYHEVVDCRMRPFSDAVQGFPRMVRDLAISLGKSVRLEIVGEDTPVDRDILERLKTVLDHLLRNAMDHGVEQDPATRLPGKSPDAVIEIHACHSAGMLLITVTDDGRGIDIEAVRAAVVEKKLTTAELTHRMTEAELLEFLFLPGFSLKGSVSEISGRGVGLDAVQTIVREVGGRLRISSKHRRGTRIQLELPLTLSVVRALLADVGGEPYAFPLSRIQRVLKLSGEQIDSVEGRQHFALNAERIGIVHAQQVLDVDGDSVASPELSVIVLGEKPALYGLVVNRFIAERELVVRPLDPRLGKVKNISAAALMPDGSPVLIIDADDLNRSIANLTSVRQIRQAVSGTDLPTKQKRVLVVEDSLTVRELERKLLESSGYAVDVAVDGMDGWNAVRTAHYDLVLTDVDMPAMDGIELLRLIRKDTRLKSLPVMIVSYKDRQQDRERGLEAGADYYLTKASFHNQTLIRVVSDLIGEAAS